MDSVLSAAEKYQKAPSGSKKLNIEKNHIKTIAKSNCFTVNYFILKSPELDSWKLLLLYKLHRLCKNPLPATYHLCLVQNSQNKLWCITRTRYIFLYQLLAYYLSFLLKIIKDYYLNYTFFLCFY